MNLLSYSICNKQNYLNISSEMFDYLISRPKELSEIGSKIEKEYIMISNVFKNKYEIFCQYIMKFSSKEQKNIKQIIKAEEMYSDINTNVFQAELKQWIELLNGNHKYQELRIKCQKLLELWFKKLY